MVTDGLGRPLYGLDHEDNYTKRRHPYTHEVMPDDYEYPHTKGDLSSGYVYLAIAVILLGVALSFI